jgi:hypothetical protein
MTGEHIDDTSLEAALRGAELNRGEEDTLGRVHARVQEHVRGSNITGPGWRWSHRVTVFAAIAVPAAAAAAIAAILIFGHGPSANKLVQPAGSPAPNASTVPSASPSAAALQTVIIESSTPANAVGPVTVHWVTTSGTEVATRQLPANEAVLGAGGSHVLIYRTDGHVLDLHMDGTSQDVGSGMPTSTAPGPASVPVRALVSPDGRRWIWGESVIPPSGIGVTSKLTLAGIGASARTVAQAVEDNHALEPYRWALANPLISHGAIGVGGYILFNIAYGQVDQLDLATGQQTPVGTADSGAVDLSGNGAKAYTQGGGAQGTPRILTVNGPGLQGLSATLPATGQAGGLMFDAGSSHLVFATSPANGPPHEQFETDIIDLQSGARTKFGPADLQPATWLPDGRLVEFRNNLSGGVPGTYVVSLDGGAANISPYDSVVGVAELLLP